MGGDLIGILVSEVRRIKSFKHCAAGMKDETLADNGNTLQFECTFVETSTTCRVNQPPEFHEHRLDRSLSQIIERLGRLGHLSGHQTPDIGPP